ncbi:hypothetical protein CALVIDRAFT_538896 [Calocera viscosa TUFC12733]|uniref:Uncharacterized protein n=1 Tax=Calocera viscosa (strain TUFC12733) TaxID=1330018 RepID=A0A167KAQ7_CALVF|nr:hypothetical protein CALVIDRAFT_538896 [Calocera viscosa TUFC12733]
MLERYACRSSDLFLRSPMRSNNNSSVSRHITTGDWIGIGFAAAAALVIILFIVLCCCGIIGCSLFGKQHKQRRRGRKRTEEVEGSPVSVISSEKPIYAPPSGPPPGWEQRSGSAQ